MVRLTVVLAGPRSGIHQLVQAFRSLMIEIRLENGCLGCSVWSDPDSTVHYFEEWATEADMRRRVRSEPFTSLLGLMEAAREPPEVRFDFLETTRGLDYVAEVRQA
ncbi:MAG: antibiotic biosynthesis monooxygenase [Acidobacteriaceae bacterium]|nr:antibiotic biosynthesis monooxygenase [Acidobacteriaceae bacterium]